MLITTVARISLPVAAAAAAATLAAVALYRHLTRRRARRAMVYAPHRERPRTTVVVESDGPERQSHGNVPW